MTLLLVHLMGAAVWFGSAMTLPFWGNRLKRAKNLDMVLGIADTVFAVKVALIMGGLGVTLTSGVLLTSRAGLPFFDFGQWSWLGFSQALMLPISLNSCVILLFMLLGRRGRRHYYRLVAPFGYTNLGLIALMYVQMALKPASSEQWLYLGVPLVVIGSLGLSYWLRRLANRRRLGQLEPAAFAELYFGCMNAEKTYELLGLFHDDAVIDDPFATAQVRGAIEVERFFQFLSDQFKDIKMFPEQVHGQPELMTIHWRAEGVTKNGMPMLALRGTNTMRRRRGKIASMEIDFDARRLPQVELYRPRPKSRELAEPMLVGARGG
jgi:hypothetical protein